MSSIKDMGNKESINQAQINTAEMNSNRDTDKPATSSRDNFKQNFQRVHNPISNSSSPTKGPQPQFAQNDNKKPEESHPQQSNLERLASTSADTIQGMAPQVREDVMPNYTSLQQPMFNPSGYNNTVFSGQMIPPMLVQQPMQLPTAIPGMFQTGFMYQTLSPGATKQNNSHFFPPFMKGSLIMLATGCLKPIEELKTVDFIESANVSKQLCLETSTVVKIQDIPNSIMSLIGFAVDNCDGEVMVEKASDHPFFIYEQGWASCKPTKTLSHYGLPCQQLKIGDICVFLSNKQDIKSDRSMHCETRSGVEEKERQARVNQQHSNAGSLQNSETNTSNGYKMKGGGDSGGSGDSLKIQPRSLIKKENEESHSFGQPVGKKPKLDVPSKSTDIVKS